MMVQIRLWLVYFARHAGLPGILGLALLATAGGYYLSVVLPLATSVPQLKADYAAAASNTDDTDKVVRTRMSQRDRVEDFHTFFPRREHALGWISVLYRAAERENLQLAHGEYRPAGQPGKHPAQMQILLPVRGSYAQMRRFTSGALAEIPFLSLDEIDFQRAEAGSSAIEAKIRFTLYLREG